MVRMMKVSTPWPKTASTAAEALLIFANDQYYLAELTLELSSNV